MYECILPCVIHECFSTVLIWHMYTGASDVESPSDCCFAAGEREMICMVTIVKDAISESDEMFIIRLDPDPGQCICEAPGGPNITVTVSEGPPPGMSCLKLKYYSLLIESWVFNEFVLHNPTKCTSMQ